MIIVENNFKSFLKRNTYTLFQTKHKEAAKLFVTAGKMDVQKIVGFNYDLEEV